VSADAENLRAVDDELAAAILEFRSEFKVLSTYVKPMIDRSYVSAMNMHKEPFIAPDSAIHTTYRQVGARTGRMSSADPNVQNQPRDDLRLRYNIVAPPGEVLVACDLSNIEMVLFAAYCGEGRLLSAVRGGEDLHVLTAKMLGFRDRKRPGGTYESARQQGKTYNFSRIYGGGLRTIRRSFRCSLDEARLLKRRFDDAYPEVGRLQNRIEFSLQDNGYIQDKLISGRRFRVDMRDSYKATNYLVQGTAASLLKYAVIQLHKDGVPMVALVHDEIVAQVPESDAQEAAQLIQKRMTEFEGLQGIVPLRADADIVKRWSDAKPLKDADGKPYYFDPKWANVPRRYIQED
jgi:DNA polymerase I-like protein with 3'-5' exonuclease and polymerase domains